MPATRASRALSKMRNARSVCPSSSDSASATNSGASTRPRIRLPRTRAWRHPHHHALLRRFPLSPSLFGTMHECGHGLYEHGVSPSLERTPVSGASLGLHESQNPLGKHRRSQPPFGDASIHGYRRHSPISSARLISRRSTAAVNTVQPVSSVSKPTNSRMACVILRFGSRRDMLADACGRRTCRASGTSGCASNSGWMYRS